ncbi:MAG: FtsQ-type POTRA domain-containing protein [Oscillospiraceae bacterium]|nr:FtsQ-type POTRA domain-containing protein [Oscillospiraceae bacterium]
MKINNFFSKIKKFFLAAFVLTFAAAVFLFLTNSYFFKIKNIRISSNDKYSYDDILKASGISEGEELYGVNIKEAENKIKQTLAYTNNVNITRIPPSTLSIEINTEKGFFGLMIKGDYYIISKNFKVMDKIKAADETPLSVPRPEGIITIETDEIKKCYIGEKIEFSDEDIYNFLKDIIKLFGEKEDGGLSIIKNIDITDKYKITMNYGDRFLVKFGIFENITPKILNVFKVIDELRDDDEGIIDMTGGKTVSFKYVENIFA